MDVKVSRPLNSSQVIVPFLVSLGGVSERLFLQIET